jgi:thioredoxin reductase (NADPH)
MTSLGDAPPVDCLVVGGGPAGLTAATYLGRFLRTVVVIDAGESRLKRVPLSRNIPGFPNGVAGQVLHSRMLQQAIAYGAKLIDGRVDGIQKDGKVFRISWSGGFVVARTVLLGTGVNVADPDVVGLEAAIQRGVVRYCPVCDGFEAARSRIAVLGGRPHSIDEAHFLRTYTDDVTFVTWQGAVTPTPREVVEARRAGIQVDDRVCVGLSVVQNKIRLDFAAGASTTFDVLYPCLGSEPRSELASALGVTLSKDGELLTDKHQETSVRGLFAAGDVLRGLDQVASACGQAAIAATAMHNLLRAK